MWRPVDTELKNVNGYLCDIYGWFVVSLTDFCRLPEHPRPVPLLLQGGDEPQDTRGGQALPQSHALHHLRPNFCFHEQDAGASVKDAQADAESAAFYLKRKERNLPSSSVVNRTYTSFNTTRNVPIELKVLSLH